MDEQRRSLRHRLDERGVDLKSLFELGQVLNASLDVKRVLNSCLLTPMGRMLISRGLALSADENGGYTINVVKGLPTDVLEKKIVFEYKFTNPSRLRDIPEQRCANKKFLLSLGIELIVPMLSANTMVGAICFGAKLTKQDYSAQEIEFLSLLSNIAATAIENALIFQRLERVNRQLDKKVQELNTLFSIGKELNSTLDTDNILNIFVLTIMGEMAANKILVYLQNDAGMELAVNKGATRELLKISQNDLKALEKAQSVLDGARLLSEMDAQELSPWRDLGIQAAIPMRIQDKTRGLLLVGRKMSGRSYQQDELEFLSTLSNRVMISLENARLFQETLEKQRLEEEIAIAREIQQRLLPHSFPAVPGMEIYGLNIPSLQVGGDYFDCFQLDDHRLIFAIGDVSGKGVGAALLMSNLHAGLHTLVQSKADVPSIVARLNELIYENTNFDKFITFFYAEINPLSKRMRYVNAGHNPPYIFHADGGFELLEKGGLILGMMPGVEYEMGEILLRPGDRLVTFTDGVTEARATSGEMYEEDRLEKLIGRAVGENLGIRQLTDLLIQELETFSFGAPQADDITLLGLQVAA